LRKTQKTERTNHYPTPSNISTRSFPAQVARLDRPNSSYSWNQKIEENMGFNSSVIIFMALVQLFREKLKKLKKWQKLKLIKLIFSIFSSKKASETKKYGDFRNPRLISNRMMYSEIKFELILTK
jgi:hypothetical protein